MSHKCGCARPQIIIHFEMFGLVWLAIEDHETCMILQVGCVCVSSIHLWFIHLVYARWTFSCMCRRAGERSCLSIITLVTEVFIWNLTVTVFSSRSPQWSQWLTCRAGICLAPRRGNSFLEISSKPWALSLHIQPALPSISRAMYVQTHDTYWVQRQVQIKHNRNGTLW